METMMTTRQIVEAIHEGLPTVPLSPEEMAAPDKKMAGNHFAQFAKKMTKIEEHPNFSITPESKDVLHTIVQEAASIRQLINDLRISLNEPYHDMVMEMINRYIMAGSQGYNDFLAEHWERLKVAVPGTTESIEERYPEDSKKWLNVALAQIILGGIENVTHGDVAGLLCVPQLYKQETDRLVRPKTWNHIGDSTLPLLLDITSSEKAVFDYGIAHAIKVPSIKPAKKIKGATNFDWPGYNTKALQLNKRMEMTLHPDIIEPTRQHLIQLVQDGKIRITDDRGGCPDRPLFSMIHKRIMSVAPDILFPHAKHILSLPME